MPKQNKKTTINPDKEKSTKKGLENTADSDLSDAEKKLRGPKSKYDVKVKPYLDKIALYTRCGVTETQIREYYDVSKAQWAEYKRKYPELSETLYKAKQEFKTTLVNKAYEVACGYYYEETKTVKQKDENGNDVATTTTQKRYAKPDPAMIQFLLINRFPADFARDPHTVELRKKALEQSRQLPFSDGEGV